MIRVGGNSREVSILMHNDQELTFYLKNIVSTLANRIGERNIQHYDKLIEAQEFLTMTFQSAGYSPRLQTYVVDNKYCSNIEVEQAGRLFPEKIIVIGAHYDSVGGCPGANDNASGVAEVLALAEFFKVHPLKRTVRFLLFVNEEPPFTRTTEMGSVQYAKACKERHEQIEAMLSIETVGYFPSEAKQERIEPWFYKKLSYSEKDFIAFVSNLSSRRLLKNIRRFFQQRLDIPSKYLALRDFCLA
jgi:hypothetical protein